MAGRLYRLSLLKRGDCPVQGTFPQNFFIDILIVFWQNDHILYEHPIGVFDVKQEGMHMDDYKEISDIALMLRVREGDEGAFEALHDRYQRRLLNFFYGMCRDAQGARDLCQETFLRIWKIRRCYRASGSFPAYLFGIARMIWRENARLNQRWIGVLAPVFSGREMESEGFSAFQPCHTAMCHEMETQILDALGQLSEEQRMVFVMRTIRGLSLPDIALAMDCPVNTVRSRKLSGLKKLRMILGDFFQGIQERSVQEANDL